MELLAKSLRSQIGLRPVYKSLKCVLKKLGSTSANSLNSTKASSSTVSSSSARA